jgi:levanase/fructan beta-fructosidase
MSNWDYAQEVPTQAWRSSMTVAREVSLKKTKDGYILKNIPVAQLKKYQGISTRKTIKVKAQNQLIAKSQLDLTKAVVDLDLKKMTSGKYTFALKNDLGEELTFGIDNTTKELFIDRSKSGKTDFGNQYATAATPAPLDKLYSNVKLKLVIDKTSIEIFFNDGEKVLTEIFFPSEHFSELDLSTDTKGSTLNISGHQLNIK